jgi:hypothetical protein
LGKQRPTVRSARWEELPEIGTALALPHAGSNAEYEWWRDQWPLLEPLRPGFSLAHHRIGVMDDRLVAHINVRPCTLRYGGVHLKVAALGKWICPQPESLESGYAEVVLHDALTYAIEQRAHLAMIYLEDHDLLPGEMRVITRDSFHSVMPVYRAAFDAPALFQLRDIRSDWLQVRPAQFEDAPHLAAFFEQQWGGRLTLARSPELWMWRMQGAEAGRRALVVASEDGLPHGYILGAGDDDTQVLTSEQVEVVASTPEAGIELLAVAGEAAVQSGQAHVCWLMPPDDGLIPLAQRYVGVTLSAQYSPSAGWRARILNGEALARTLLPELQAQLRYTQRTAASSSSLLELKFGAEGVEIGLTGQPNTFAHLHQSDFVQLLFGAVSPAALALRNGLNEASVQLLQAVFPQRIGAVAAWDWF